MTAPPDLREFDEKIARSPGEGRAIDGQDFEGRALRDDEKNLIPRSPARVEWRRAATWTSSPRSTRS